MKKKRKWLRRALLFLCLIFVLGLGSFFVIQLHVTRYAEEYICSSIDNAPVCDAVIVLGALVYNNGYPSAILRDRLDYGYELYTQGKAKKILVSGDHGRPDYDEVNAMKDYLLNKGVPEEDIFMDHAGFNTYDSMYRAKEIFCIESMLVSTQEFHIGRSVYIARKLGIEAYGYPCEDKPIYAMKSLNVRESLARVKAFGDVLVMRDPVFLGEPLHISGDGRITAG